jgi:hypothetical protein
MMYNFYLDGNLVENPIGWDEMITQIKRDKVLKGLFITMDVTFTFDSKGFTYLKNVFDTQGYCSVVTVKIEQSTDQGANYYNFYDGILNGSDIEFMIRGDGLEPEIIVEQYAKVKVLDNSFFSKIFNNRKLKTNICAGKTKNGLDITPCPVQYLRMFDPATGIPVGLDQKEAILWYDVFKYLIEFMTDAEVEFDSDIFKPGTGDFSEAVLTYGLPIWNQGGGIVLSDADFIANLPLLDFDTFFHEIDVRANLGLYIDNSGSKPKVRIERWNDLFLADSSVQINNINALKTRISVEDIFSRLKLGNTETLESLGALSFPETIQYIGFQEEEYIVLGKCNIDTELDLTGDFIVSSNIIEEILINNPAGTATPNKTYNKNFFLIDAEYLGPGLYLAKKSNWLDATLTARYYNERFTNSNVANNFLKAVPNDIAAYLGGVLDASFLAEQTYAINPPDIPIANGFTYSPVEFNNKTVAPANDPFGVYTASPLYEFTVPALGNGTYSFNVKINFSHIYSAYYNFANPETVRIQSFIYLRRYDSIGNFIAEYQVQNIQVQNTFIPQTFVFRQFQSDFQIQGSTSINLNAGDTLHVRFATSTPTFATNPTTLGPTYNIIIQAGDTFSCTGNTTGGGNYQTYDPSEYPIIEDSFEQEMSKTVFDKIAASPLSLIEFSQGSLNYKKGWINELRYDHEKGFATVKLLSAKNTN